MFLQAAAGAAIRYLALSVVKDDYYTKDAEKAGVWFGAAAKRLGLVGQVTPEQFARLARNLHPFKDEPLTPRHKQHRRVGYDITFSAPKSVSIVYVVTQDQRIIEAFRSSVHETLAGCESLMQTRVRRNGADHDRVTGNMIGGEYLHLTTRPVDGTPDPLIHIHAFTFNCTFDGEENRWKAGQFGAIKSRMPMFEAEFHSRLASQLESLGYGTTPTKHAFEIAGITRQEINEFSRRTNEIESIASERGYDADQKASLGAKTRQRKRHEFTFGELRESWLARLQPGRAEAISRLGASSSRTPDRSLKVVANGIGDASGTNATEIGPIDSSPWGPHLLNPRLANQAAKEAIKQLLEHNAVVPESRLLERALRLSVGRATPADVRTALAARPELVRREVNDRVYITTKEALKEEKYLVNTARIGRGRVRNLGIDLVSKSKSALNDREREVHAELLSSKDVVTLFKHTGPSQKPELSRAIMTGIQQAGHSLWVVAPNAATARQAESDYGIKHVHVVHTVLNSGNLQMELKGTVRRRVLWIENAGELGTRTVAALARVAEKVGARIVLSGDTQSSRSTERGDVFRLLRENAGLTTAERRVVRDKEISKDQAIESLFETPIVATRRLHELGKLSTDETGRLTKKAVEYYTEQHTAKRRPLLVTTSSKSASRLNAEVRDYLRSAGEFKSKDRSVVQYRNLNWTNEQKRDLSLYRRGLVIHFHQPSLGFKAGDRARVVGTGPFGTVWVRSAFRPPVLLNSFHAKRFTVSEVARTHLAVGDRIRLTRYCKPKLGLPMRSNRVVTVTGFDPVGDIIVSGLRVIPRRFGHFEHDYATTTGTLHGRRVDAVGIVLSEEYGSRIEPADIVNAASSGKKDFQIFTRDASTLVNALEPSAPTPNATDLADSPDELDLQHQDYEARVRLQIQDTHRRVTLER